MVTCHAVKAMPGISKVSLIPATYVEQSSTSEIIVVGFKLDKLVHAIGALS